jgi:hypothetical protein
MDAPTMSPAHRVAPDVTCLPSYFRGIITLT